MLTCNYEFIQIYGGTTIWQTADTSKILQQLMGEESDSHLLI
jgi:hypothetical protein